MDNQSLIEMLNKDLADEHAAIVRYVIHSYLEGEDSPLGAGDEMVIGYNREKIAEVIKKIRPQGRFSLRRFFSGQPG
jgi:hypothetical protein